MSNLFCSFLLAFPDEGGKPTPPPPSQTPEHNKGDSIPTEATSFDTNTKPSAPHLLVESENTILNTVSTLAPVADVMDAPLPQKVPTPTPQSPPEVPAYPAPLPDPVPSTVVQTKTEPEAKEEVTKEVEIEVEESLDTSNPDQPSSSNGVEEMEQERPSIMLPPCHLEDPLESPIAQPEELRLPNGLPLPAPRDPEALAISTAERDDSPIAEPDISQQPVVQNSTSAAEAPAKQSVQATPVVVDQPAIATAVKESPAQGLIQETTSQPDVKNPVPEADLDVKDDTQAHHSNAKEETPSPTETVYIANNTPETPPPIPTSTTEEREDIPPQTVSPALVETTMQGQSLTDILYFCHLCTVHHPHKVLCQIFLC